MKRMLYAATALAMLMPLTASAQSLGKEDMAVSAPKMSGQFWAPKPAELTPYTAPNKPHWKLSEILASHKGQTDWVQPIVRNKDQVADYISMGAGKKTKMKMYPDDRIVFIHRWRLISARKPLGH